MGIPEMSLDALPYIAVVLIAMVVIGGVLFTLSRIGKSRNDEQAVEEPEDAYADETWAEEGVEEDIEEYEVTLTVGDNTSVVATTFGPASLALSKALQYAATYNDDGKVEVFLVSRTLVHTNMP